MYKGPAQSHRLENLKIDCEYVVRVCAVRLCMDGSEPIIGTWSEGRRLRTQSQRISSITETNARQDGAVLSSVNRRQLTDQQWAVLILLAFAVFAVIVAFAAQQIIAYTSQILPSPGSTSMDSEQQHTMN